MNSISKTETTIEIETIINNLIEANERIHFIGKYSPDTYQSRLNQLIVSNDSTIQYLQTLKNSLKDSKTFKVINRNLYIP